MRPGRCDHYRWHLGPDRCWRYGCASARRRDRCPSARCMDCCIGRRDRCPSARCMRSTGSVYYCIGSVWGACAGRVYHGVGRGYGCASTGCMHHGVGRRYMGACRMRSTGCVHYRIGWGYGCRSWCFTFYPEYLMLFTAWGGWICLVPEEFIMPVREAHYLCSPLTIRRGTPGTTSNNGTSVACGWPGYNAPHT